jgi:hypothetical protein
VKVAREASKKRKHDGISKTIGKKGGGAINENEAVKRRMEKKINKNKEETKIKKICMPSDTYPNGAHHDTDPVKQNNPVIIDEPFYHLGTSNTLYKPQLEEMIYYEVIIGEQSGRVRHFGPILVDGKAAAVGTVFKTSDVEYLLGIPHGGNEGSLCWNAEHPNGILMKHAYKNDVRAIKKIMEEKKAHPMWLGLSGGNPEVKGQSILVGSKMTTNFESGYFPKLQKLSKQNIGIMDCALINGTVTIFFLDDEDKKDILPWVLLPDWLFNPQRKY